MIRAIVFDLDGVLVQTEKLKALSYAKAVQQVLGLPDPDTRAVDAYREIVGSPRDVAAKHIVERLGIQPDLLKLQDQYGSSVPFEILTAVRRPIYLAMVADSEVIRENQWPHTIAVLRTARRLACRTGLATMSQRYEAEHVLRSLGLEEYVDVIVAAEDIKRGKPDPEVYVTAVARLQVAPSEALALEDSVNGVKAAVAAGVNVIAISTPFTKTSLQAEGVVRMVGSDWMVSSEGNVARAVRLRIKDSRANGVPANGIGPMVGSNNPSASWQSFDGDRV